MTGLLATLTDAEGVLAGPLGWGTVLLAIALLVRDELRKVAPRKGRGAVATSPETKLIVGLALVLIMGRLVGIAA